MTICLALLSRIPSTIRTHASRWQARYAAYGAAVVNGDVDGNGVGIVYNQRLPGQYADPESGVSYNYMRYYDATLVEPSSAMNASGIPAAIPLK
jgi:hypothetical protein